MVRGVLPVIRGVLGSPDQRLVENAALCIIRIIESYHRSSADNLTSLLDSELIQAICTLLLPGSSTPLLSPNTYTLFIRALSTAAKASPKITLALLDAEIVQVLYQLLTGVLPPTGSDGQGEQGGAESGQGLGGGRADMAVMENLAHRPKDQVEEALSLVSELLPPLPKGILLCFMFPIPS
jgi:E3 ubiquitin-protein ligase TRIP12